jgi:hypothetical protein
MWRSKTRRPKMWRWREKAGGSEGFQRIKLTKLTKPSDCKTANPYSQS